jgi:hypothetical protein
MRSRLRPTAVSILTLLVLAGMPAGAAPTFADACVSGPATSASAAAPHVWDKADDHGVAGRGVAVNGGSADIRSGWVAAKKNGFTANIQLTSLLTDPVNQSYRFEYPGADTVHYVAAEYGPVDGWTFTHGYLEGVQQVTAGSTSGSVNADDAIITIDLPAADLPRKPTDGRQVTFTVLGITAQQLIGAKVMGAGGGLLTATDTAVDTCTVILYEAVEDA